MFRSVKYLLIFFCCILTQESSAQQIIPQYNFQQLNVQNGLAQNIVYHFLQDSKDYVWIGTHNGLTKYDGRNAISFLHDAQKENSLASNFITRILEDTAHQVWIGNEKGIDLFNRADESFTHYGVDRPNGEKDNTYCVPTGFVSPTEFWFIDPKTKSIRAFNTKTRATQFVCDMDEVDGVTFVDSATNRIHFWSYQSIGTVHLVFKGRKLIQKQTFFSTGDNRVSNQLHVVHALQQNDSTTWLSTNEGLICLNPLKNTFTLYNKWNGETLKELRYAAFSPDKVLSLGSGPSGIYTFDINRREFTGNYRNNKLDPFSICSNNIVSLYFDRSGNLWCGSYGNGASYTSVENNFFTKHMIRDEESMNNIVWLAVDRDENCWCLVEDQNGFWVFDKTFSRCRNIIPRNEDGTIFDGSLYRLLVDGDEHLWCASNKGLYLYNIYSNKMRRVNYDYLLNTHFGSNVIKYLIKLHDGSVVFSTFGGLYRAVRHNNDAEVKLYSRLNDIYDKSFSSLFQDEEENLFVKGDDSLFILKTFLDGREPVQTKAFLFAADIHEYFSDVVQRFVYIATSDGLYVLDKKNLTIQKEKFTVHVPFQSAGSVFEKNERLWIFGEKGLYSFDKKTNRGRTFTIEDGLPGNEFNVSVIGFAGDGKCIAGTTRGLVSFYPDKLLQDLYPPRAQLDYIYINDTMYDPNAIANETNQLRLTYRENTFAFEFSAVAFQHNRECTFEYKLDGFDKGWIQSGYTHYTRYSKIPPGSYHFIVRVYDVNGVPSAFTKELRIEIAKAFWQTNLFTAGVVVLIFLIGWLMVKAYLAAKIRKQKVIFEKQQAVEQERTRIAMEMHDDLGSGLTAISYLAGSLSTESSTTTRERASKIANSAKTLVDAMNDIIWTMKSDNNSVKDVLAYIKKQAAEQLETAELNFTFAFPGQIPDIKLNSEQKRNVLLISKEIIHNVIKHANATEVVVTADIDDRCLQLTIADNGRGFDPGKPSLFGNGLKNMQRRAREMNAQLEMSNRAGTTVKLTLTFG